MTKIYIYCLFAETSPEQFKGVYSSIKAAHRDALKLSNRGDTKVYMFDTDGGTMEPSLVSLRNSFKGKCDVTVKYRTNRSIVSIYKTRLKE